MPGPPPRETDKSSSRMSVSTVKGARESEARSSSAAERPPPSSSSEEQSLSTTPTQSYGALAGKDASQSSTAGYGPGSSLSVRSSVPSQSTPQFGQRSNSTREPSSNLSYAHSEVETASGISASEYSSGDDEGDRSTTGNRTGTLRGRPALQERSSTYMSQASNASKATLGVGGGATAPASAASGIAPYKGKRRPSASARAYTGQSERDRSKARRASLARDDDIDDDEDGRFGPLDDEDDEVEPHDRGEELVRRRMKARAREKAARKKAEKEKQQQQQLARRQAAPGAGSGPPLSPRPYSTSRQSMVVSPSPQLEREGQPTFISLPGQDMSLPPPTLSPMLVASPGAKGGFQYPSPHSHIRRPSGRPSDSISNAQGRRVSINSSTTGPPARAQTSTPQLGHGQDVFSETGASSELAGNSSLRDGSVAPRDEDDDDDEERDTVAGLATEFGGQQRGEPSLLDTIEGDREGGEGDAADGEGEVDEEDLSPSLSGEGGSDEDVEYTLKDRQDAINIEHPFGLPIWKPALYKKSRTVTRNAESALHSIPSAAAERHLLPGNLLWTIFAGFWLSLFCFAGAILINLLPYGGPQYARVVWELGGYLFWPFGKYVVVEVDPKSGHRTAQATGEGDDAILAEEQRFEGAAVPLAEQEQDSGTPRKRSSLEVSRHDTIRPGDVLSDQQRSSGSSSSHDGQQSSESTQRAASETTPLNGKTRGGYGSMEDGLEDGKIGSEDRIEAELNIYGYVHDEDGRDVGRWPRLLGTLVYGLLFWLIIAPLMGLVCLACWGLVFPIPMAKLSWVLLKNLSIQPLALHFRSAPAMKANGDSGLADSTGSSASKNANTFLRLRPGQFAPRPAQSSSNGLLYRRSKILLCTYRAMGLQYYKYTVGGVNILFINTLPFVFFTIFDFFFVEPYVHKHHMHKGLLAAISSQEAMFVFALGSVIPLSYFIGMAVASISAQSSIGMGAVINATFGSIIEIILYAIALTQHKARLVEGSIIGSILAGVLLMPGISMCSGATRRKEQRFNAKSAGVTSSMLIMAIIGILTPTLFYQIYGTFQLTCQGCPDGSMPGESWTCKRCFYEHVPPATDPFYQENVKGLMYTCTIILVLSYGIGLWFSLRTHASQIWQNPQPVAALAQSTFVPPSQQMAGGPLQGLSNNPLGNILPSHRGSIYKRLLPAGVMQQLLPTQHTRGQSQTVRSNKSSSTALDRDSALQLPEGMSQEEYERAITLTANAFHHALRQEQNQQMLLQQHSGRPVHARDTQGSQATVTRNSAMPQDHRTSTGEHAAAHNVAAGGGVTEEAAGAHGGHDAPSWTRTTSLIVLLSCTVLYAIIAEILVDAVDVVLEGSGLDLKLLGVTLFALVPNATEFMNAMSFAINGNIALSMEIGSAYALQVCLIQIPAMVAFSAFYNAHRVASVHDSFTLIFPRWDVIAIIFAIFLLTYTYIEARSNYFRGSLCILSYIVLVSGFVFAPSTGDTENPGDDGEDVTGHMLSSWSVSNGAFGASPMGQTAFTSFGGLRESMVTYPALVGYAWLEAVVTSLWAR